MINLEDGPYANVGDTIEIINPLCDNKACKGLVFTVEEIYDKSPVLTIPDGINCVGLAFMAQLTHVKQCKFVKIEYRVLADDSESYEVDL